MTAADREAAARRQRAQTIALWRWALIEAAMGPAPASRPRGPILRGLGGREGARPRGRSGGVGRQANRRGTGGRACYLAAIIDDHSRFLTGHQFVRRPDAIRFAAVLRSAMERHGIPAILYTDHGGCFTDASLARTCAVLGIRLVHSQPGKPAGRGKIERVFETIQQQFLVEISGDKDDPARHPLADLRQLNDLLDHRVRAVYHHPVHSETGQAPQARFDAAGPAALPDPALLRQAFAWRVVRLVRKAATGALGGNTQSGDPSLRGREVELGFDPLCGVPHSGSYARPRIMGASPPVRACAVMAGGAVVNR